MEGAGTRMEQEGLKMSRRAWWFAVGCVALAVYVVAGKGHRDGLAFLFPRPLVDGAAGAVSAVLDRPVRHHPQLAQLPGQGPELLLPCFFHRAKPITILRRRTAPPTPVPQGRRKATGFQSCPLSPPSISPAEPSRS